MKQGSKTGSTGLNFDIEGTLHHHHLNFRMHTLAVVLETAALNTKYPETFRRIIFTGNRKKKGAKKKENLISSKTI